jgi:sugar-specific transcriptional regulator TrmB
LHLVGDRPRFGPHRDFLLGLGGSIASYDLKIQLNKAIIHQLHKYSILISQKCNLQIYIFVYYDEINSTKQYLCARMFIMDLEILRGIGLTEAQAKTYLELLKLGEASPPELAQYLGETRTTMYSVLEQLQKRSLALRLDLNNKIVYRPAHPVNLEVFVERRRNVILNWEYKMNSILPGLIKDYFASTEQPAVRFFQGREALERVYQEILEDKNELLVIIPAEEHEFMGEDFIDDFVENRVKKKIKAQVLSPLIDGDKPNLRNDKAHLIKRYWYSPELYQSPVEVDIFGDKVAYLSFGKEVFATIIHSPQIAQSARDQFNIIKYAKKQ